MWTPDCRTHLIAAAVMVCGLLAAQRAHASLVGHWKLDEGSSATTAVDDTGGTNGAVGSNVTTGLAGISGNAYQFAGGSTSTINTVDLGDATSVFTPIIASGQLTVSAWFNWTDNPQTRTFGVSLVKNTANDNYTYIGVTGSAGRANTLGGVVGKYQTGISGSDSNMDIVNTTGYNDGGTQVDDSLIPEGTGTALNDGTWHHVVMTVDTIADRCKLFVDGVNKGLLTDPSTATPFASYNDIEFGILARQARIAPYIGLLDDVQIYDEVLESPDINFLFDHPGVPVPEPASLALLGLGGLSSISRRRRT